MSPNVAKTRPPDMPLADDWFRGEQAQAHLSPQDTRMDVLRTSGRLRFLTLKRESKKATLSFSPLDANNFLARLLLAMALQPQRETAIS